MGRGEMGIDWGRNGKGRNGNKPVDRPHSGHRPLPTSRMREFGLSSGAAGRRVTSSRVAIWHFLKPNPGNLV